MRLHSFAKGSKSDPAVFILHGLLGTARNLYRLAEVIANAGFFTVAFDQRGHGHSEHAPEYNLPVMAEDIVSLMHEYGIKKAHLVGHSMGARVSLACAAAHPDQILSLTMLDAGIRINARALHELHSIIDPLPESYSSKEEAQQDLNKHPIALQQFLLSNLRTIEGRQKWVFDYQGIRTQLIQTLAIDQTENWKSIHCPILVARGAISQHFLESELEEMLLLQPNATRASISGAAHWVHADNFQQTAQTIILFLKSL